MSIKKVRLLIKTAIQTNNEADKNTLLALADEVLANMEKDFREDAKIIKYPLAIFRRYKGKLYNAELLADKRVAINGDIFTSPSAAAVFISGHPENGWRTWRCMDETTNTTQPIDRIR